MNEQGRCAYTRMISSQTMATGVAHAVVGRTDRVFYTGMSLASVATVFVGFAPT